MSRRYEATEADKTLRKLLVMLWLSKIGVVICAVVAVLSIINTVRMLLGCGALVPAVLLLCILVPVFIVETIIHIMLRSFKV